MHRLLVKMDAWEQDRQSRAQILQLQNRIDELQAALEKSQTEHGKTQTLLSESHILQPPMIGDIPSSNQSEKVEEAGPTPSLERRGSASSSTSITKSPIIRYIYGSDADLYRNFQHMAMSVSLARAKIAGYCQNWMAMEVHAKNAAENSLPLDNPSMTAHCNYIQAIALYNQGNFVHAGELFEDSEACVGVYIKAEDFSGWLRRLDQLDLQSPAFSFSRPNAESFPNTSECEPAPSESSTNLRDMSRSQQSPGTHHTWQNLGDINLDSLDSASEKFFPTSAEIDVMPYVDPRLRFSPSAPSDDCPSAGFESTKNHLKDDIGSLDEVYSTKSKARPGNAISFSIVDRTQDSSYLGSSGPSNQMLSSERASRLLDEHTKMGSAYNADPIRPQVGGLQPVRLGLAEHADISGNDGLGIEHIPDGPPNSIQPTNIFSIESNPDPGRQSPSAALDISTRSVKPLKCLSSESSENDPSMSLELMETLHLPRSPRILTQPANRFSIESGSDLERDRTQNRTRFAPFSISLDSFDPNFRPPSPKFALQ